MTGKVHVAVGVVSVGALLFQYPTGFDLNGTTILPAVALVTAAAGSYAPDIDLGRSHSGMKHKTASKVVSKIGGGHRGITHTLLVPTIVLAFMLYVQTQLTVLPAISSLLLSLLFGWEVGYLAHIFADLFNGKGVPLFWPIIKGKVHIADLPSDGFGAWMFAVLYTVCIILYLRYGLSISF